MKKQYNGFMTNHVKRIVGVVCVCAALTSLLSIAADTEIISSVVAKQRFPWNGKVDIVVTFTCASNDIPHVYFSFVATNSVSGIAIDVASIEQNGITIGSGTTWSRKFVWDSEKDVGTIKIDDAAFTVDARIHRAIQLWEDGPYWDECNVGAENPEDYGYYFWWGDTVGYKRNSSGDGWVSVKDGVSFSFSWSNAPTFRNRSLLSDGYIDSTGNLTPEHDAASVYFGSPWRMPTRDEIAGLVNNCTTTWTTRNGVYGRLVTGKGDYSSKSIFLPAAGYGSDSYLTDAGSYGELWSSTPNSSELDDSVELYFSRYEFQWYPYRARCYGLVVRPVREFAN